MNIYTVSFFGHRKLSDTAETEKCLESLVSGLIRSKEYVEFLVGRGGEFDMLVSSVIRRTIRKIDYGNASHILVLPYLTAEYLNNCDSFGEYYSSVEVCERSAAVHFRAAYFERNRAVIDRSDMVVCYVERQSGGAYKAMHYAERNDKTVINIAEDNAYNRQQ